MESTILSDEAILRGLNVNQQIKNRIGSWCRTAKNQGAVLKKSRWCLLKLRTNLPPKQRVKLRDVFRYNLQSVRVYLFK